MVDTFLQDIINEAKQSIGWVGVNLPNEIHSLLGRLIDPKDLAKHKRNGGIETKAHVTIVWGLDQDFVDSGDLISDKKIQRLSKKILSDKIEVLGIGIFELEDCDVIYLDVDSDHMYDLHDHIVSNYDIEFNEVTAEKFHLHSTIAYVKKGKGSEYVELIEVELYRLGMDYIDLFGINVEINLSGVENSSSFIENEKDNKEIPELSLTTFMEMHFEVKKGLSDDIDADMKKIEKFMLKNPHYSVDEALDYFEIIDPDAEYQVCENFEDGVDDRFVSLSDFVNERVETRWVVRNGDRMKKKFSTKDGYKMKDGKEVKISAEEKRTKTKAIRKMKKTLRKQSKSKLKRRERKRQKSIKIRKRRISD